MTENLRQKNPTLKADIERGVVSRVFNRPIYLSQVDFAVDQRLWSTGKDRSGIHDERRRYLRAVALIDIQDQYILREKVRLNADDHPVSEQEIDEAVKRFSMRFNSTQEMTEKLKLDVSDDEAQQWYEEYKDKAAIPERINVQHIFISRLPAPGQTAQEKEQYAKKKLDLCYAELTTADNDKHNSLWLDLAAKCSEDERTKNNSYEEMKPEIILAIETFRRKEQVNTYRINLRKQHGDVIKTNWQIMANDWTN